MFVISEKMFTTWILLLGFVVVNGQDFCLFPNEDIGIIVKEGDCPTPESSYHIGMNGDIVEICCLITRSESKDNKPKDTTPKNEDIDIKSKDCRLSDGTRGTLVQEENCLGTFQELSNGSLGNSSEICCPQISVFAIDEDKGVVPGPVVHNRTKYESCQINNADLGLCVKQTNCTVPSCAGTCESSETVCCPVSKLRYTKEAGKSDKLTSRIAKPGDISKERCFDLLTNVNQDTVYNGREALPKEFKHMAAVGYGDGNSVKWGCGGTLISRKHVLTAAHCVIREIPSVIRLGELDLSPMVKQTVPNNYRVKKVHIHDGYKPPAKYHDIAIIELTSRVLKTDFIDYACLDTSRYHDDNVYIVSGWGKTEYSGPASPKLLTAEVTPYDKENCRKGYGVKQNLYPNGIIDEYMLCAGGKSDTCSGDSGGPLVVVNQNLTEYVERVVYNIIGVTSFGKACGLTPVPGVYTRVQPYLSWIEAIVWPESS